MECDLLQIINSSNIQINVKTSKSTKNNTINAPSIYTNIV